MSDLHEIVNKLMEEGKGLLAADESNVTANKRLASVGITEDAEHRRQYRELFIGADGIGDYISGIILYDETMWQADDEGRAFLEILKEKDVLIGIKVDQGKEVDPDSPDETVTKGLEGLADRLREYKGHGAVFAKWRAVIRIGKDLPTESNIRKEAVNLAAYAKVCQEVGIVPVIEPEVLRDGNHSIEDAERVINITLRIVFDELQKANIDLQGTILKTSMAIAGSEQEAASPGDVATATVRALQATVPVELGGIVFLSGGQAPIEATENLNAINKLQPLAWKTTFSFARALQQIPLKIWSGDNKKITEARADFAHRMKMNSAASKGEYSSDME